MASEIDARRAALILNALPGVGPVGIRRLCDSFDGDITAIFSASRQRLMQVERISAKIASALASWEQHVDIGKQETLLQRHSATFVMRDDADYPALLREIYDPPLGFYRLGPYAFDLPGVSIVGTRRPTLYGRSVARRLGRELAQAGFCVVSGMARGIDSEAHEGALEADGCTVAVLGCGADIVYPPENLELYRRIQERGAVISEFPFGRRADKQTFPMRNRLIAGMTRATIVVESGAHGGSMITARFAAEQDRLVFAVPGRIDQDSSTGCHALIRDGATLLTGIEDVFSDIVTMAQGEMSFGRASHSDRAEPSLPEDLDETQKTVASLFADGSILAPDTISGQTGLPVYEVTAALMMLELRHVLAKRPDGSYERRY